jgi:very-short-patch-repair endonuclease
VTMCWLLRTSDTVRSCIQYKLSARVQTCSYFQNSFLVLKVGTEHHRTRSIISYAVKRFDLTEYAKQNREVMTPSEKVLWALLRKSQLGVKFRSQQPVGPYILDFYSAEVRLGIEVDGSAHVGFEEYDAKRDRELEAENILILRFTNDEVAEDIESVLTRIRDAVEQRMRYRY